MTESTPAVTVDPLARLEKLVNTNLHSDAWEEATGIISELMAARAQLAYTVTKRDALQAIAECMFSAHGAQLANAEIAKNLVAWGERLSTEMTP